MPTPSPIDEGASAGVWGTAVWGVDAWGVSDPVVGSINWKSIGGEGYFLAPGFAVTTNQTTAPRMDVTAGKIRFEVGRAF